MIKNKFKKTLNKIFNDKRVALIKLEGIIIDNSSLPVATKLIECFENAEEQGIKNIVLRINSPGGTVGASQEIHRAIMKARENGATVVASFADVSASGGYYIATACDKIVSNAGTITGSIGVIIKTNVIKSLYDKIGIDHQIIKSGSHKDILSNIRYLSEEEKLILQSMVDDTYKQFLEVVRSSRKLKEEDLLKYADGRIYTGNQAFEFGLVDAVGSQSDAVDLLCNLSNIKDKPKIITIEPKKTILQKITGSELSQMLESLGLSAGYAGMPLWLLPGILK
ncbi:MAG: signal peptide peptidase SppA [bacterium]